MPFGIAPFTRAGLLSIKHAVRDRYPQIKSGHFDEAMAYALGFDTYAAMLPVIELAEKSGDMSAVAKPDWFLVRLSDLGYDLTEMKPLSAFLWSLPMEFAMSVMATERAERARSLLSPKAANDG
ncbi:hypothetical protein VW23_016865 [Devosia insulae DS-56]|uniref:Uncharacterized protein n=1 Tax=Devosia insulae DS-56 TaxID=1116389 RepID=A0A1E5XRW4_9HYPH|nr:hypothetical protein [Devosia insulae]OEO31352.1 hypothetical protein VW23_016865 [Devosia insulae DS-56]